MKPFKLVATPTRHRRLNELVGLLLLAIAGLLLLSLASYRPADPSLNTVGGLGGISANYGIADKAAKTIFGNHVITRPAHNWIGIVGATVSDILLQVEGLGAFCIPLFLAALGFAWMFSRTAASSLAKLLGFLLCLVFVPAMFGLVPGHLLWIDALPIEGVVGRLVVDTLVRYVNYPGTCVLVLTMVVIAVYLSTAFSFSTGREWLEIRLSFVQAWRDRWANWKQDRADRRAWKQDEKLKAKEDKSRARELVKAQKNAKAAGKVLGLEPAEEMPGKRKSGFADLYDEPAPAPTLWEQMPRAQVPDLDTPQAEKVFEPGHEAKLQLDAVPSPTHPEPAAAASNQPVQSPPAQAIQVVERADADLRTVTLTPKSVSGFKLPPSSLLFRSEEEQVVREDELRDEAKVLVEKCAEFGVLGQIVQINPGPVVTTFEFRPEAGVKYSRVTGLAEDLCLAMRAESILIERMSGKSTVGIQVPNHTRETIWLRDIIESETFANAKSKLTLAMGKDINGRIVTADLTTMPHVLIAGSTGSGKSVAINAMIMSVLYRATPDQVRLILVDPKRVELGMYEGIPHLFTPIITEPKLAANALRNAVREMERRLKLLASRSVRNIDQYNKLFESGMQSLFSDAEDEEPLPYIIIIIDELADLMMLDKANVEESITRLAQMARAVGIHLILATQRPSVDVITGLIKANVPTRISFRLATKVDSRTIIDSNGAESLLGRGDMLFLPPGTSRVQRLHAPFLTEKETAAVVGFWKNQGEAEYVPGFLEGPRDAQGKELEAAGDDENENDELYEDAVRLILEFGKASTSLIQRRLRVGYGRAAHLIDMMERDGIVGPADGSKPREILKPPGWLSEVDRVLQ